MYIIAITIPITYCTLDHKTLTLQRVSSNIKFESGQLTSLFFTECTLYSLHATDIDNRPTHKAFKQFK